MWQLIHFDEHYTMRNIAETTQSNEDSDDAASLGWVPADIWKMSKYGKENILK